jgi:hypothetical protein
MFAVILLLFLASPMDARDDVVPGDFFVERPTLICLGFQWYTSGDDNKNAKASIKFRRVGEHGWEPGLDLWRLNGQRCGRESGENSDFYEPPHMFAGSLFDLEPATEYECTVTISDPDGVAGGPERTVRVSTRREPQPPADSRILHLGGQKADFEDFRHAVTALKPGDTLLVHAGLHRLSRRSDADFLENHAFTLDLQGTAERPITIQGAGDGQAVLDGQGSYMLLDVQNSQHLILDGLTLKGADFAVYAGGSLPCENEGIVVRDCTYENIKCNIQGFAGNLEEHRLGGKVSEAAGRIRHVGGPSRQQNGVRVNPGDGGRVFRNLGNALFGDDRWSIVCERYSKRRDDLIQPGDTVIVHEDQRLLDRSHQRHWGGCYFYKNTFMLNLQGTPEQPITIRGEGRPVFDGVGNYKIFDLQGSEHVVIEGLHFRNAAFAIYKGQQTVRHPVVGLTVRNCRFEDVGCGVYGISGANRDFFISDNVFVGRCRERYVLRPDWKQRHGLWGFDWQDDEASYSAVHLAGQGHVIRHNSIYRFFDGLQMQSNWATSPMVNTYWTAGGDEPVELRTSAVDIYNNILHWTPDNAIEADMAHHNIRIMRNLCVDSFGAYWSNQFVMGGPCYWIRNVAYSGCRAIYKGSREVGVLSFHNTMAGGRPRSRRPRRASVTARPIQVTPRRMSCGDLVLEPGEWEGVFLNPPRVPPREESLVPAPFSSGGFVSTERSPATDGAVEILPNINDNFKGDAPDLGAHEWGGLPPHYGPRRGGAGPRESIALKNALGGAGPIDEGEAPRSIR